MIVWAIGNKPPPPTPCRPRANTKLQIVGANAQAIEPPMKIPIAKAGRRAGHKCRRVSKQRGRRRHREQISRHHPGQFIDAAKASADGGQCRRDDGLLKRGQKHRQHNAGDDCAHRRMIEGRG